MNLGLMILLFGLAVFFGVHVFVVREGYRRRDALTRRDKITRAVHGLVSLLGFVLIVYGFHLYRQTGYVQLWQPPMMLRHLALVLNMPVFILVTAGILHGYIKHYLKYPVLVGIKLWALAHLCANGDLGSAVLFGTFLAWAVALRIVAKRRGDVLPPLDRGKALRNDLLCVLIGLGLYIAMLRGLHYLLIGVDPV